MFMVDALKREGAGTVVERRTARNFSPGFLTSRGTSRIVRTYKAAIRLHWFLGIDGNDR
jgi:hypothetical protein